MEGEGEDPLSLFHLFHTSEEVVRIVRFETYAFQLFFLAVKIVWRKTALAFLYSVQ
jgi:hypothetical protein